MSAAPQPALDLEISMEANHAHSLQEDRYWGIQAISASEQLVHPKGLVGITFQNPVYLIEVLLRSMRGVRPSYAGDQQSFGVSRCYRVHDS